MTNFTNKIICKYSVSVILAATCFAISHVRMPTFGNHVLGIVLGSPKEQVARVDAGRIVASVADEDSFRDCSIVQFPRDTVSQQGGGIHSFRVPNLPMVPFVVVFLAPRPDPARAEFRAMLRDRAVFIDLWPETISQRDMERTTLGTATDTAALFGTEATVAFGNVASLRFESNSADFAWANDDGMDTLTGHDDLLQGYCVTAPAATTARGQLY